MKILLINTNQFKQPWPVIPFGLCCVATAMENAGYEVKVLDLCFSRKPADDIQKTYSSFQPDLVGMSIRNIDNCAGFNTQFLLEDIKRKIVDPCKAILRVPIIIGGPAVGISGAEMLDFFDLEYAVRGEGEAAFLEFAKRLEASESFHGIDGLLWRQNGTLVEENPPAVIDNLDQFRTPEVFRHINISQYRKYHSPIQIQTKRGCVLDCSYCTYNRIEGKKWRLRDPQSVADDIESLVANTGIRHIEFTDSVFNLPLQHCKSVLRAIIAKKMKLNLRTMGLNPSAVDEELVSLLKQADFCDIDLGAESLSDKVLAGLHKTFRKEDVLRAGRLLRKHRIPVTWYLLLGGPGETKETIQETFQALDDVVSPWDLVNIGVGLRVYKGSPIAKSLNEGEDRVSTDNFFLPYTFEPKGISLAEVKHLAKSQSLRRTNYFMYDEDEKTPLFVLRLCTRLLQLFAPTQPLWRSYILMRQTQKWTGVNWVKSEVYRLRHLLTPALDNPSSR